MHFDVIGLYSMNLCVFSAKGASFYDLSDLFYAIGQMKGNFGCEVPQS